MLDNDSGSACSQPSKEISGSLPDILGPGGPHASLSHLVERSSSATERRRQINRESARRIRAKRVADADDLKQKNADQERTIADLNYQIATLRKENIGLFEQNSKLVQQNIVITEDLRMFLVGSNQMENPGILSMPRMIDPLNSSETSSLPTTTAEEDGVNLQMLTSPCSTAFQQCARLHSPMTPSAPMRSREQECNDAAAFLFSPQGVSEGLQARCHPDFYLPFHQDLDDFP